MKRDRPYLQHIYDSISDIEGFVKGVSKQQFFENKEKQYAVMRALEIIGEATKNISRQLRAAYPEIPWKTMAGMRDKLIHEYFGVKLERLWEVIQKDLPRLKEQISKILRQITDA
jgi:uncharacterized protein with HEPN domain